MFEIKFYDLDYVANDKLKYAVIVTKHKDKWVLVRHKERSTWEIPGGRREEGEDINITASRELVEETGAREFDILPISIYSVKRDDDESFGQLFYSYVEEFNLELNHEIGEVKFFDKLPIELTYPLIQPHLLKRVKEFM